MNNKNTTPNTGPADTNQKTPGEEVPVRSSDYNELAQRLRDTKGVDQDIAMLVAMNWQRILWGLVVVLLIVWLVGFWRESKDKALSQASQRLEDVQSAYASLVSSGSKETQNKDKPEEAAAAAQADQEQREKSERTFADNISLLRKQEGVYGELAPLYEVAEEIQRGNWAAAKEQLAHYSPENYIERLNKASAALNEQTFVSELAALIYLRLLAAEGATDQAVLRSKLSKLAAAGRFVNVEAVIMLFRLSTDGAQRLEAENAAKELAASRPDLAETLKVELGNQGVALR